MTGRDEYGSGGDGHPRDYSRAEMYAGLNIGATATGSDADPGGRVPINAALRDAVKLRKTGRIVIPGGDGTHRTKILNWPRTVADVYDLPDGEAS
jgi:hypothetical protein